MSYMTKDQLENYLQGLPSNAKNNKNKEYNQLKSELVYPMQKLSVNDQQNVDEETYGTVKDRMNRLRDATGTVLNATTTMTPAFPETPKPLVPSKPSFTPSKKFDAFEASLNPRKTRPISQQLEKQQALKATPPSTPPLPPPPSSASSPPPAVPSSPRPPKPVQKRASTPENKVRTLNPIYAGRDCPACHKPIEGSVISAMDKIWHVHCFTCSKCRKPLQNEKYFEKDNKAYCSRDYRDLFSLHCDFCHEPIEQSAISALGKHYHEGHFCCTVCHKPFGDRSAFLVHEDKPYCQEDYMKVCGKKCSGCGQYISGEYINALDQEWHKPCFSCTDCKKPFTSGTFLVRDNKPFCEEHYHHPLNQQSQQKPAQREPPQSQQQQQPERRKPPAIKPKPMIGKKTESPVSPSPAALSKRPEIPSGAASTSRNSINNKPEVPKPSTGGAKLCHVCNSLIDGPCANALGHDYHIHHFQCSQCSRTLSSRVPGMWQGDKKGELVCKMCAFKSGQ